jgi:hypothetical protein
MLVKVGEWPSYESVPQERDTEAPKTVPMPPWRSSLAAPNARAWWIDNLAYSKAEIALYDRLRKEFSSTTR